MRPYVVILRQSLSTRIDPDASDAFALRASDIPFEVVANHPRFFSSDVQVAERPRIDPGIGLAEPYFALDQNHVEQRRQIESFDLAALSLAAAVGQQRQSASTLAKPCDGRDGFIDWFDVAIAQRVIRVPDSLREGAVVNSHIGEREPYDLAARPRQIETTNSMAFGIGPVPLADSVDSVKDSLRRDTVHHRTMHVAGLAPAADYTAGIVEDGVVEIEKNRSGKRTH